MGNVSADGKTLWLRGRYDNVVYAIDTDDRGKVTKIPVGKEPHGLTVWPQPGPLLARPHRQHALARRSDPSLRPASRWRHGDARATPVRSRGMVGRSRVSGAPLVHAAGSPGSQRRRAPSWAMRSRARSLGGALRA